MKKRATYSIMITIDGYTDIDVPNTADECEYVTQYLLDHLNELEGEVDFSYLYIE